MIRFRNSSLRLPASSVRQRGEREDHEQHHRQLGRILHRALDALAQELAVAVGREVEDDAAGHRGEGHDGEHARHHRRRQVDHLGLALGRRLLLARHQGHDLLEERRPVKAALDPLGQVVARVDRRLQRVQTFARQPGLRFDGFKFGFLANEVAVEDGKPADFPEVERGEADDDRTEDHHGNLQGIAPALRLQFFDLVIEVKFQGHGFGIRN